jgi:hypothetical protein
VYFLPIIHGYATEGAATVAGSVQTTQELVFQRVRTESLTFKRLGMFRVSGARPCSSVEACIYFTQLSDIAELNSKTYLGGKKAHDITLIEAPFPRSVNTVDFTIVIYSWTTDLPLVIQ